MGKADCRPVGVFDSGVGGLTVLKAIRSRLPRENLVYLGDTARLPYGTKSARSVLRYAHRAAEFLRTYDIKMLVVACNTASAVALEDLGRRRDAIDAYRDTIGADPEYADAYFNLARLLEQSGDRKSALRYLKTYRQLTEES